jgi:peptidoglycan hydrolase-like protein with peptidoglycan-binding domain
MLARLSFGVALAATLLIGTAARASDGAPLQIFVSKGSQSLVVYDGDQVVATSNVSTGKAGHTTPSGIFSILEKRQTHFSNLYDDAPMPWMQRLTWSGIALHESKHVPSYPASHGCVRMPAKFAKSLWGMTSRGFHVIISDRDVAPRPIQSSHLFTPRIARPQADLLSDAELRPAFTGDSMVELALADVLPKIGATAVAQLPKDNPPVKILITRASEKEKIAAAQSMLNFLGYDVGPADGIVGVRMRAAVKAFQELRGRKSTGLVDDAFLASIHKVLNRKQPTGWLYVRRNFTPVFDVPIDIADPEVALGTHFIQAARVNAAQNTAQWYGVSLDNHINAKAARRLGITVDADPTAPDAVEQALARITMTDAVRDKIDGILGPGSSITITDIGTEHETGQGTDFITVTRPAPRG